MASPRRASRRGRACALLLLLGAAAAQNANMSAPLVEMPYGADGRVTLYATLAFLKLGQLDAVKATFYTDYYLSIAWRDDRAVAGEDLPKGLWVPDPERINSPSDTSIELGYYFASDGPPSWAKLDASDGVWIQGDVRLNGELDTVFKLQEFPYDSQKVFIMFESKNYDDSTLVWAFPRDIAASPIPPADGWIFRGVNAYVTTQDYPAFGVTYSRAVRLTREP